MLVSVTLPTHARQPMLRDAIKCYVAQDWPEKELVVIDDADDCCRDWFEELVPASELNYVYLPNKAKNLSAKRNLAAQVARGGVLIHFDSDDWSAPDRISHQMRHMLALGSEVGGYHTAMFWNVQEKQASCYHGYGNYAWGPNLLYTKDFWKRYEWPEDIKYAEDAHFVRYAQHLGVISAQDGQGKMVIRLHEGNSHRTTGTEKWPNIDMRDLPKEFFQSMGWEEDWLTGIYRDPLT